MTTARWMAAAALAAAITACSRSSPAGEAAKPPAKVAAEVHGVVAVKLCEHGVPADLCTQCNPELVAVFKEQGDWCEEHGLPESQCLKCNPKLTFTAAAPHEDWCKEHAVPESKCTKCNPRLVAKFVEAGDYCREHGYPESVCPICHRDRIPAGKEPPVFPEPGLKVRLASVQTARDAGIETRIAEARKVAKVLQVVGQLDFDQNRLAQLSARGEALVVDVKVDVGDEVKEGQPLVVLTSAAVGADQARLAGARARLDAARLAVSREEQLAESGLSPRKSLEEARRELAAAQAEHGAAASALGAAGAALDGGGGRHVLRAPFAGTVVARDAVTGEVRERRSGARAGGGPLDDVGAARGPRGGRRARTAGPGGPDRLRGNTGPAARGEEFAGGGRRRSGVAHRARPGRAAQSRPGAQGRRLPAGGDSA